MSYIRETYIRCNRCRATYGYDERYRGSKASDIRANAVAAGWSCYARHGETMRDKCPSCKPMDRPRRCGNNGNTRNGATLTTD